MHLRRLASRALLTAIAMTPLSPVEAQLPADRERMSPEGRAVFESFFRNPDADLQKCFEDGKVMELRLIEEGEKPAFDWAAARALLNKQAALQASCSMQAHKRSIEFMEQLPANDRAVFYRSMHRLISPPVIRLPTVKKL